MNKRDKLRELIVYVFYGVLTTAVNMIVLWGLEWLLKPRWGGHSYLFSNTAAFVVALVFAFVVNKLFVFKQKSWERRQLLHEAWTFTSARLLSFGLDTLFTVVFFDLLWPRCEAWFTPLWLRVPVAAEKIIAEDAFRFLSKLLLIQVMVVILNYFFSKHIVFKTKRGEDAQP
ncbi:MAG: GtrA family protein [Firmicutes bacterium]|nr:GtrA family protein [Bacillota bacterium]